MNVESHPQNCRNLSAYTPWIKVKNNDNFFSVGSGHKLLTLDEHIVLAREAFVRKNYIDAILHADETFSMQLKKLNREGMLDKNILAESYFIKAMSNFRVSKHNAQKAKNMLKHSIYAKPTQTRAYYGLAEVHLAQGKVIREIEDLTKIIEIKPENVAAYCFIGDIYQERYMRGLNSYLIGSDSLDYEDYYQIAVINYNVQLMRFLDIGMKYAGTRYLEAKEAIECIKKGEPEEAVAKISTMINELKTRDMIDASLHYIAGLALSKIENGKYIEEARIEFEIANDTYPLEHAFFDTAAYARAAIEIQNMETKLERKIQTPTEYTFSQVNKN